MTLFIKKNKKIPCAVFMCSVEKASHLLQMFQIQHRNFIDWWNVGEVFSTGAQYFNIFIIFVDTRGGYVPQPFLQSKTPPKRLLLQTLCFTRYSYNFILESKIIYHGRAIFIFIGIDFVQRSSSPSLSTYYYSLHMDLTKFLAKTQQQNIHSNNDFSFRKFTSTLQFCSNDMISIIDKDEKNHSLATGLSIFLQIVACFCHVLKSISCGLVMLIQ